MATSPNYPNANPVPGQTVTITPQLLPNQTNAKLKLLTITLSIVFGVLLIMTMTSLDFVEHGILVGIIIAATVCIIALSSCMICRHMNRNQGITGTQVVVPHPNTVAPPYPYAEQPGYTLIAPLSRQNRSSSGNPTAPGTFLANYTYTPPNNSTARSYNAPSSIGHYPVGSPSAPAFPVSSIPSSPGYQPPPGISSTSRNEAPPYGNNIADTAPEYQPPPPYTPDLTPPPYTPDMAPPPYEK